MQPVRVDLGDGAEVLIDPVEVQPSGAAVPAGVQQPLRMSEALERLQGAVDLIAKSGKSLARSLVEMETHEATLKVGVAFTAEGSVIISKTGASVNFELTFTWKAPEKAGSPGTEGT